MLSVWTTNTLLSGVITVMKLFDVSRQLPPNGRGRCSAVSMVKGMTDYSVSSSQGNLASYRVDRPMVSEARPEEIEGATLPQVHDDPVLKRYQKLYHSFVRDLKSLEHVGMFFLCTNPSV